MKKLLILSLATLIAVVASAQTTTKKKTSSTKKSTTTKTTTTTKKTTATPAKTSSSPLKTIATAITGGNVLTSIASLSDSDIISGLKDALSIGAGNASKQLNQVNGFSGNPLVRIPFPPDAQRVAKELRNLGFGAKVDEFELTLNRAAETAAKEAAPIFINAVTSMTFADAKSILTGPNNSATTYLQNTTSNALIAAFTPHIASALNTTTATQKWSELASIYNKIPFVNKVETDLVKYTTNKALSGLFTVLAGEELKIRQNPASRVTDIMKKVFGATK
jgi:hypothetical protein